MIGKGKRTAPVIEAMQAYPAVYFAAIGGAAALMASCVTSCEVIAYDDLGPESIKRLTLQERLYTLRDGLMREIRRLRGKKDE